MWPVCSVLHQRLWRRWWLLFPYLSPLLVGVQSAQSTQTGEDMPCPPLYIYIYRIYKFKSLMYAPFCHACIFSLGPSCSAVCRRGNLQRPVPHCLWVAQWPLQDCHLWIQVRKHCWIFECLYRPIVSLQMASSDFFLFCFSLLASTRSSRSILMNLMMSDENNRDIYVTIASMPPPKPCSHCCPFPSSTTIRTG